VRFREVLFMRNKRGCAKYVNIDTSKKSVQAGYDHLSPRGIHGRGGVGKGKKEEGLL